MPVPMCQPLSRVLEESGLDSYINSINWTLSPLTSVLWTEHCGYPTSILVSSSKGFVPTEASAGVNLQHSITVLTGAQAAVPLAWPVLGSLEDQAGGQLKMVSGQYVFEHHLQLSKKFRGRPCLILPASSLSLWPCMEPFSGQPRPGGKGLGGSNIRL